MGCWGLRTCGRGVAWGIGLDRVWAGNGGTVVGVDRVVLVSWLVHALGVKTNANVF